MSRARSAVTSRAPVDAAVLGGYLLVAFLFFGLPLLWRPGSQTLGRGYDSEITVWAFAWFPHALLHGENPLISHAIWAPQGANLTWAATVPGLSLLFAPLTWAVGPIGSYNVAAVLVPALGAWTGYLLCRYLTGSAWPSVLGGFLFGFSSYVIGQVEDGHPHMSSVFLLPLVALVVLRFLDGRIGGRRLVLELGVILAFEVVLSTEVAFTLSLATVVSLLLAFLVVPARRPRIRALLPYLAGAYVLAAILTAPFLYYALTDLEGAFNPPTGPGVDLLNVVVPTRATLAFGSWLSGISSRFPSNIGEQGAYLGLPILIVVALFARDRFRAPSGRFLLAAAALAFVAELGAKASVAGRIVSDLPWMLVHSLPLVDNILTGRFAAYLSLVAAVIVSLWTAYRRPGVLRWALPLLAVLAIVPDPRAKDFSNTYGYAQFFKDSSFRSCLRPGETVLLIPQPEQVLVQAVDAFRFRLAGGYVGPGGIPKSYLDLPNGYSIAMGAELTPGELGQLRAFIAANHVTSLIVEEYDYKNFASIFNRLAKPQHVGGIALYHLYPGAPPCPAG